MKTADAVIIGGGVIGAAIAYHLSLSGLKNIIVLDKARAGAGSTGKATGGFRAQFGSRINILLSLLSRQKLLSFMDETGVDPSFEQKGYLFLAQSGEELSRLSHANKLQKECGLAEAEMVSADDIRNINPYINSENITGGSFCSADGFISPLNILKGYTGAAESRGALFLYDTEVTELLAAGSRISSAVTKNETYSSAIFINAAGAWSAAAAGLAGINIAVTPLKRQVCRTAEKGLLPSNLPMTIWIDNSFHFRMRDGHLILLRPCKPANPGQYDTAVEPEWLENTFSIAKERIPLLKGCSIDKEGSWAGLYEMSPDEHALLGLAPGLENFYLANGSSGHGVMHSPAIGQLIAELITGGQTSIDISSLSPGRFEKGKLIESIEFF